MVTLISQNINEFELHLRAILGIDIPEILCETIGASRVILAKDVFSNWLEDLSSLREMRWLVPAHYSAPIPFSPRQVRNLKNKIDKSSWASGKGNWKFLDGFDRSLLKGGVVPSDPLGKFKG